MDWWIWTVLAGAVVFLGVCAWGIVDLMRFMRQMNRWRGR